VMWAVHLGATRRAQFQSLEPIGQQVGYEVQRETTTTANAISVAKLHHPRPPTPCPIPVSQRFATHITSTAHHRIP
jgi:hypothetical protein